MDVNILFLVPDVNSKDSVNLWDKNQITATQRNMGQQRS